MKENLNKSNELDGTRLSPHFKLGEFLNLKKYPENVPSMQVVVNLTYGCHLLLEPARQIVGPIIINSGFRNEAVNRRVGGVKNSQHLIGQAVESSGVGRCSRFQCYGIAAVGYVLGVLAGVPICRQILFRASALLAVLARCDCGRLFGAQVPRGVHRRP